jgi:hypothetical protein
MPPPIASCAPFVDPRRDAYFARARIGAGLVCALAKGVLFLEAWLLIRSGMRIDAVAFAVMLAAMLVVWTRVGVAMAVFLGIADRLEGLHGAPAWNDIWRRAFAGVVAPLSIAVIAVRHMDNVQHAAAAVVLMALVELVYRGAGFTRWPEARLHEAVLRALEHRDLEGAARALAQDRDVSPAAFAEAALLVSTAAVTSGNSAALETLVQLAGERRSASSAPDFAHIAAIAEADLARLRDTANAAAAEAAALRILPRGHRRRLTFALFVATAALDSGQPEAAVSALARLHTRELPSNPARVVANWLLMQGAEATGDAELAESCRRALATFDIRAEADAIAVDALRGQEDAYARWVTRARQGLLAMKSVRG